MLFRTAQPSYILRRARTCVPAQPMEIFVDDEAKLTLHGLVQHYIMPYQTEMSTELNSTWSMM